MTENKFESETVREFLCQPDMKAFIEHAKKHGFTEKVSGEYAYHKPGKWHNFIKFIPSKSKPGKIFIVHYWRHGNKFKNRSYYVPYEKEAKKNEI